MRVKCFSTSKRSLILKQEKTKQGQEVAIKLKIKKKKIVLFFTYRNILYFGNL